MSNDEKIPVTLFASIDGEQEEAWASGDWPEPGEERTVRLHNPDAENGFGECRGGLSWLNSARITADPNNDEVTCVVSVGDPRGGFAFTVRRLEDGRLVIHTPHPSDPMPHCETEYDHEGTLLVAGDWSDPEDEEEDEAA